eukprot:tig00000489_g1372.t1
MPGLPVFSVSADTGGEDSGTGSESVVETHKLVREKDESGSRRINQYIIREKLGAGSYGKVKICIDTNTNKTYAVKIMKKSILKRKRVGRSGNALQNVLHEIAIMKKLNHPNVVRLYEVIDDPEEDKLYLVMELMPGGPVAVHREDNELLTMEEARRVFRELINGLEYLHHHKILHRDIKPENILKGDDGSIKIGDFGVAYMIAGDDDTVSKTAGTPAFLSPESLTGDAYHGKPVDIWAAGVTLYYFVFGQVPYLAPTIMGIYEKIQNDPLVLPREVDPALKSLLLGLLEKDPDKRLTIPEIKVHDWVTNHGRLEVASAPTGVLTVTEEEIKAALKVVDRAVLLANLKRKMAKIRARAAQRIEVRKVESGESHGDAWKVLSALDYLQADGSSIDLALFYPMPLEGETVKAALEVAAHAFRPVSSALGRRTLDGALVFTSSSIHFRTVYVDALPDASCGRDALLPFLDPVSSPTPPAGPAPDEPRRPFVPSDVFHKPLMRVRLSTLRSAPGEDSPRAGRHTCSILAVSVARVVCDPPALCQFLVAWARAARRLPFPPPYLPRHNVAPSYAAEPDAGELGDDEREARRTRAEADIARGCAIAARAVEPPAPTARPAPSARAPAAPGAGPLPLSSPVLQALPAPPERLGSPLGMAGLTATATADSIPTAFETSASAGSVPAAFATTASSATVRVASNPAPSTISLHGPAAVRALESAAVGLAAGAGVQPERPPSSASTTHGPGPFSTFGALSAYGSSPGPHSRPASPFDAVLTYLNAAHDYEAPHRESPTHDGHGPPRPHSALGTASSLAIYSSADRLGPADASPRARPRSAHPAGSRPGSGGPHRPSSAGGAHQRPSSAGDGGDGRLARGLVPPGSARGRPASGRSRPTSALSWAGRSGEWSAWGQPLVHVLEGLPPPYTASEAPPRRSTRLDFTRRDLEAMMRDADALARGLSPADVLAAYTWKTCVGVLRDAIAPRGSVVIATAGPPGGDEAATRASLLVGLPPPSRRPSSRPALPRAGSFASAPRSPGSLPGPPCGRPRAPSPGPSPWPPRPARWAWAPPGEPGAAGTYGASSCRGAPSRRTRGAGAPPPCPQRLGPEPRGAARRERGGGGAAAGVGGGAASWAGGGPLGRGGAEGLEEATAPEETWLVRGVDLRERLDGVGPDFFGNASAWVSAALAPDALRGLSLAHVAGLLAEAARRVDPAAASAYVAVAEEIRARAAPRVVLSGSRRKFSLVAPEPPIGGMSGTLSPAAAMGGLSAPKGVAAPSGLCRGAPPENALLVESFAELPLLELDFGRGAPYRFEHLTAPAHRAAVLLPSLDGAAVRLYNL